MEGTARMAKTNRDGEAGPLGPSSSSTLLPRASRSPSPEEPQRPRPGATSGVAVGVRDRRFSQGSHINCWEYRKCGREPGGENVAVHGVCPAAIREACDGVNGGRNAGRCCWSVAGTLCGGTVTCLYGRDLPGCLACDFYALVQSDRKRNRSTRELSRVT